MVYLLVLFFVSQIGFWLRFVIKGIFDLQQFALSCLFLVAALILFIITLRQSKRDIGFQPVEQLEWQTKITEYMKTSQKKLTRHTEVIFTYERYYKTIWQRLLVEVLNAAEKNVHLKFEGDVSIRWHEQRQKIYQAKRAWHLYLNNEQIGMARYEPSIKNALKFEHTLWIDIQEISYKFLFYKGSSQVLLYKEDRKIGEGDITKLYKGHFYISIDDEQELILATAFVLLHYMHN